ncbi:hypothetical protein TNCV_2093681 [Trichonephila clavipes]|nr:hypothetical protein TNCV_2093681 [Trichonephila clavipes]
MKMLQFLRKLCKCPLELEENLKVLNCIIMYNNRALPYKPHNELPSVDEGVRGMKTSSSFSPDDDSTRIPLSGTFRLITEKNTPSFLWCS